MLKLHFLLFSLVFTITFLIGISVTHATSPTICETLKLDKLTAYRTYQEDMTSAQNYSGDSMSECQDLWTNYRDSCEEYTDANLIHWIRCIKPNIPTRIKKRTEQAKLKGEMDALVSECSLNAAQAYVEECL